MKLRTIREARDSIRKVATLTAMPAHCKFRLAKIMRSIDADVRASDTVYNDLLSKYGKEDEQERGLFRIEDTEQAALFREEWDKVLDSDVDTEGAPIIVPPEALDDLTVGELMQVDWLITVAE